MANWQVRQAGFGDLHSNMWVNDRKGYVLHLVDIRR